MCSQAIALLASSFDGFIGSAEHFLRSKWLADHQTFAGTVIGSLIGFTSLSAGYLLNARLTRGHGDRLHRKEAASLAASLRAEVAVLASAAQTSSRLLSGWKASFDKHPDKSGVFDDLEIMPVDRAMFDKISDKLGYLGPDLAFRVSNFHFRYSHTVGSIIATLAKQRSRTVVASFVDAWVPSLDAVVEVAKDLQSDLLKFSRHGRPTRVGWKKKKKKAPAAQQLPPPAPVQPISSPAASQPSTPGTERPVKQTGPEEVPRGRQRVGWISRWRKRAPTS